MYIIENSNDERFSKATLIEFLHTYFDNLNSREKSSIRRQFTNSWKDYKWVSTKYSDYDWRIAKLDNLTSEYFEEIDLNQLYNVNGNLMNENEILDLLDYNDGLTPYEKEFIVDDTEITPQVLKDIYEEDESLPLGENLEPEYEHLKKNYDKLARQNQYYKDTLRITRRENRFNDRIENVIENFHKEILDSIPKFKPSEDKIEIYSDCYTEGIIQLSDIHCGEYVKGTYNYDIMDKRLDDLFNEAVNEFEGDVSGINKITILMTGDLINAASKMDKLLTNLKTRAESLKILFQSISKQIDFLINKGYKVKIASICGNESRLEGNEYMSGVDEIAVNNMDYLLMVLLEARYKDAIEFLNDGSTLEEMVNINGKNILINHGHNIKQGSEKQYSDEVLKVKKKWFNKTGIMADYEINGHIHNVWISSFFARSGSLVGGNGYSENTLNIPDSKPSQNIYKIGDKIKAIPIYLD